MKAIKIKYVDMYPGFENERDFVNLHIQQLGFDVQLTDDPDYLIYSCFGHEHLKYMDCVKIYWTGENIAPDFNLCDYAIDFCNFTFGDRNFYHPLFHEYVDDLRMAKKKHLDNGHILEQKKDFCAFVVSNGNADPKRDEIFDVISCYKTVNSGGRYRNNIGMPNGVPNKLDFLSSHKFSICAENCCTPGYVTEKIIQGFAAKTVPIYWGDPEIADKINPKSFINAADYDSPDALAEQVAFVDSHDEVYLEMLNAPALLPVSDDVTHRKEFDQFLTHIFNQELKDAKRRCNLYHSFYYQNERKVMVEHEQQRQRMLQNWPFSWMGKIISKLRY